MKKQALILILFLTSLLILNYIIDNSIVKVIGGNDYLLTINVEGSGSVTGLIDEEIACGGQGQTSCENNYAPGTVIVLTAQASSGYTFSKWTGCDNQENPNLGNQCTITMNSARTATASFSPNVPTTYSLNVNVQGSGSVTGLINGEIACGGQGQTSCENNYAQGTNIVLTANPSQGYIFNGWEGCDQEEGNTCKIIMNSDKTVTAKFKKLKLTITKEGEGTITSSPSGINCGNDCTEDYDLDTQVILTAVPDQNYNLFGWEGDCSEETSNTCILTMNSDKNIKAVFTTSHELNVIVNGYGFVTSNPEGINCIKTVLGDEDSLDCDENYTSNQEVILTAAPDDYSEFKGWAKSCQGTDQTCNLIMDSDKKARATFELDKNIKALIVRQDKEKSGFGYVQDLPSFIYPNDINCGDNLPEEEPREDCIYEYDSNQDVQIKATPIGNSIFSHWKEPYSCSDSQSNPCTLTISSPEIVVPVFNYSALSPVSDSGKLNIGLEPIIPNLNLKVYSRVKIIPKTPECKKNSECDKDNNEICDYGICKQKNSLDCDNCMDYYLGTISSNNENQLSIDKIEPGKYDILIGKNQEIIDENGYKYSPYLSKSQIKIKKDKLTKLKAKLQPITGNIEITTTSNTNPVINVYVDYNDNLNPDQNELIGTTSRDLNDRTKAGLIIKGLDKGEYNLILTNDNRIKTYKKAKIKGGKTNEIKTNIDPGKLEIECKLDKDVCNLNGANVYIDNEDKGLVGDNGFTLDHIGSGEHLIKITKSGYKDYEKTIKIKSGEKPTKLKIKLKSSA